MTNVIVDAGTDAKIARFQKRGIEMIEVGVLEPVEVWGEKERGSLKGKKRDSLRLSVDEAASTSTWSGVKLRNSFLQPGGGSRPGTPSATSSLHSSSHSNLRMASPAPVLAAAFPVPPQPDQQQQLPPILDSTTPTPMPQTQTQVQFMPQAPPQKRNIFNKLFNKRSSLVAPSSLPPLPSPPSSEPEPTFSTFSLHPAPVPNKLVVVQDFDRRKSKTPVAPPPPPLTLGSPPQSPSSHSSQTTPRQTQTPRLDLGNRNANANGNNGEDEDEEDGLVSPTPTVAPPKERGHGRNSSLTVPFMNNPFKTTLIRSGKNRLSAVVGGGGADKEKEKEREKEDKGKREERKEEKEKEKQRVASSNFLQQKRDASPANLSVKRGGSRSQLSLHGGGGGSIVELNGGAPLMLTQSQAREELSNLKQQQLALRPPILGIQPTFVSPAVAQLPPNPLGNVASPLVAALSPRMSDATQENLLVGQRALMYVWLVRKWLKRRPVVEGEGGRELGLFGGFNLKGNNAPGLGYGGVEVRFEWKRTKTKGGKEGKEGRKGKRGRPSTGTTVGVESDDELAARERTTEREKRGSVSSNVKERLLEKRRNRMSTGSFSTTTASEEGGEGSIGGRARPRREGTIDDGEESDPEDSETPWVCTLKIRRMATAAATDIISPPASAFSDGGGFPKSAAPAQPQIMRLKVGTLSPTPHHPKVVAMLKVPFPLPDVEVERMGVVRRKGYASSQEGDEGEGDREEEGGREPYYGLTLTAEEIKDIVCSTGLWLVVREGFGGVGRVSRKGDGWRIRA